MSEGVLSPPAPPEMPAALRPSRAWLLRACPLRYAWESMREPPRLPSSPRARVGQIVHRLLERAGRGQSCDAAAWDEESAAVEAEMAGHWLERWAVPLHDRVRNLEETKLKTLARAAELGRGRSAGGAVEPHLVSPDGLLAGRLDRVAMTPDGPVVRDYKSGRTLEEDERTVLEHLRVQMLLYAALHHRVRKAWPVRLELWPLVGSPVEVPFSPMECDALVGEFAGKAASLRGKPAEALATPDEEACRYCPYRPVCPAWRGWHDAQETPTALWGTLRAIKPTRGGLVSLETDAGTVGRLSPGRNPALALLRPGDAVAAFNLNARREAGDLTAVYKLPGLEGGGRDAILTPSDEARP